MFLAICLQLLRVKNTAGNTRLSQAPQHKPPLRPASSSVRWRQCELPRLILAAHPCRERHRHLAPNKEVRPALFTRVFAVIKLVVVKMLMAAVRANWAVSAISIHRVPWTCSCVSHACCFLPNDPKPEKHYRQPPLYGMQSHAVCTCPEEEAEVGSSLQVLGNGVLNIVDPVAHLNLPPGLS